MRIKVKKVETRLPLFRRSEDPGTGAAPQIESESGSALTPSVSVEENVHAFGRGVEEVGGGPVLQADVCHCSDKHMGGCEGRGRDVLQ